MNCMLLRSKGDITINAIVVGLLTIALVAISYYMLISKIIEVHTVTKEYETERHAINLANVLISSDLLAYEENGKIYRGVLNASKLDELMYRKNDFLSNIRAFLEPKDMNIGYPNSYMIVEIIDLDTCNGGTCDGWIVSLKSPEFLGLDLKKFVSCLGERVTQNTILEFLFKWFQSGQLYNIFSPFGDIGECARIAAPTSLKDFFYSGSLISRIGLPVSIWYPNGETHLGRIVVGVSEW